MSTDPVEFINLETLQVNQQNAEWIVKKVTSHLVPKSIPESPYLTTNPPTQQTVLLSSCLLPANLLNCLP